MKAKLKGAETGHSLLKRKSEALTKYDQSLFLSFNFSRITNMIYSYIRRFRGK